MTLSTSESRKRWAGYLGRAATLSLVIGTSVYIFTIRDKIAQSAQFGYPGIFLFTLLTYASVILPLPGVSVVFAMGAVFNPFWVGVAAGAGAALGELTGYAAGYSGQVLVEQVVLYQRIRDWLKQGRWKTFAGLVILSAVPNPAFDLAGIASGVLRIPLPRFLFAVLIGETIKMWFFAYAGAYSIDWIMDIIG